jgi:lysophospholipase L1-like esterase
MPNDDSSVRARLRGILARTGEAIRTAWGVAGMTLALLLVLELGFRLYESLSPRLPSVEGFPDHPYAHQAWFPGYRAEFLASLGLRWQPYTYWARLPYAGQYINVDSGGHRRTVQTGPRTPNPGRVYLFGGSTMWGTGARDSLTIASRLARALEQRGVSDVVVTNFGENGYVLTQELLRLELALRNGERPAVVVFYDGINDVVAGIGRGTQPGWPQNESNREEDFDFGRLVRTNWNLRTVAAITLLAARGSHFLTWITTRSAGESPSPPPADSLGREVVRVYAATAELAEALSQRYGFQVLYFWQPTAQTSAKPLSHFEHRVLDDAEHVSFYPRYRVALQAAAQGFSGAMAPVSPGRAYNLTDLFRDDSTSVFLDAVGHVTEEANARIAAAMVDPVALALARAAKGKPGAEPALHSRDPR